MAGPTLEEQRSLKALGDGIL
eukprot:COSAG01_NODE_35251_length_534_cov_12.154023_2_plen_20_part_01